MSSTFGDPELSPEQATILDDIVKVVEAGPGSGKTRALVGRYLHSAQRRHKGVCLLSFTNAAVDEVRHRVGPNLHLLKAPHFVGTFDSFLHRFFVTPYEMLKRRNFPNYLDTWDSLPDDIGVVRIKDVPGTGVRLSRFTWSESKQCFSLLSCDWNEADYIKQVEAAGFKERLFEVVRNRLKGLWKKGIFDSTTARLCAFRTLKTPEGSKILERLGARFGEVLIDEAQDCNDAEIKFIELLESYCRTLVVADPDQAIYGFRGGGSAAFKEYRDRLLPGQRIFFSENWRSTNTICQLIGSLRAAATTTISSRSVSACLPIFVLKGSPTIQRQKFCDLLRRWNVPQKGAIVLAYKRATAATVAGFPLQKSGSRALGNRLAAACASLGRVDCEPSERLAKLKDLEAVILSLIEWPQDIANAPTRIQLECLCKPASWLRCSAAHLVASLLSVETAKDFGARARATLAHVLALLPFDHKPLGQLVRKPSESHWKSYKALVSETGGLRYNTIHGAKGLEFPAVLVVLEKKKANLPSVLDDWAQDRDSEARRVLYVAASRAEKLLAFGSSHSSEMLQKLLHKKQISFEVA